jgi:hypothetical protein
MAVVLKTARLILRNPPNAKKNLFTIMDGRHSPDRATEVETAVSPTWQNDGNGAWFVLRTRGKFPVRPFEASRCP